MSRDWTKKELNATSEVMKKNGQMGYEKFCKALEKKQPVDFDFGERSRKELVGDINELLRKKVEYVKMPTCAYQIGNYTIVKDCSLTWSADTAVMNLNQIIESKGNLLMKAIGTENLPHCEIQGDRESGFLGVPLVLLMLLQNGY